MKAYKIIVSGIFSIIISATIFTSGILGLSYWELKEWVEIVSSLIISIISLGVATLYFSSIVNWVYKIRGQIVLIIFITSFYIIKSIYFISLIPVSNLADDIPSLVINIFSLVVLPVIGIYLYRIAISDNIDDEVPVRMYKNFIFIIFTILPIFGIIVFLLGLLWKYDFASSEYMDTPSLYALLYRIGRIPILIIISLLSYLVYLSYNSINRENKLFGYPVFIILSASFIYIWWILYSPILVSF